MEEESLEPKSDLNNQHLDSPSDHSSTDDNDNNLVQAFAQHFETLVLNESCQGERFGSDRDPDSGGRVNGVKQPVDDELREVVVNESLNGAVKAVKAVEVVETVEAGEEKNHDDVRRFVAEVVEVDREEEVVDNDDNDDNDDDLNGKQKEIEVVDDDGDDDDRDYEDVENEGKYVDDDDDDRDYEDGSVNDGGSKGGYHYYPLRPDAEDCSYYMRTGMCKYGSNCKFNHPLRRKHQPNREIHKQKEEHNEMHGQIECKYYSSPAGCKYGKSCKFSHGRGKTGITPVVEHNFLGLPIRPGEKECPYYMRNGSCKYGPNCRFNHPDPSAVADAPTTYGNDGPLPLKPPPQPNIPNMPTWSGPRTPNPAAAFVPVMYPPTQNIPPPSPEWNGYPAPAPVPPPVPAHVYPSSDRGLPIPPAFFLNNPPSDANMYTHHQQPVVVSEYPERPGQPDCSYFMKTGDCKYRSSCKFHHPKSRIARSTPSVLSDKGLPLRPDQNICTYYSRYGICKYGPACKYDHPVNYNVNSIPAGEGYDGSQRSGSLIQQSV